MDKQKYLKAQRTYTAGYLLSAALTLTVYVVTVLHNWTMTTLAAVALLAAALQLLVQSKFFLHLKFKKHGAWKLYSYVFTWIMLLIVVVGSLWVMMNLNYNMHMSSHEMLERIQKENSKGF
jgi:cytochrome o ubiquinol oxidase operon protein cyoD